MSKQANMSVNGPWIGLHETVFHSNWNQQLISWIDYKFSEQKITFANQQWASEINIEFRELVLLCE